MFILALMAIPNNVTGRLCFLFCGGTVFVAGAILYALSKRTHHHIPDFIEEITTGAPLEDETEPDTVKTAVD